MPVCAVPTCATTHRSTGKSVTLYRFPKDSNYARIWVRCCLKKDTFNTKSAYICSLHFAAEAYQRDINHDLLGYPLKKNLRRDAVPTLQLPSLSMLRRSTIDNSRTEDLTSYYHAEKRTEDKLVDLLPDLSPKSFTTRKLSSERKTKRCSKPFMKNIDNASESASGIQTSDSSETRDVDTDSVVEINSDPVLQREEPGSKTTD